MAIDTAEKRFSMITFNVSWGAGRLFQPDGANVDSINERQMMLGAYSGLSFLAPGVGTGNVTLNGRLVTSAGVLITVFLNDATPVPADSFYVGGSVRTVSGASYICLWPGSGIVSYDNGIAIRGDGAIVVKDAVGDLIINGLATSNRGELCVTTAAPDLVINGIGIKTNGRVCVSTVT